jgi:hypothetical protein
MNCKGVETCALLKTMLLQQSQIFQHKKAAPTHIILYFVSNLPLVANYETHDVCLEAVIY